MKILLHLLAAVVCVAAGAFAMSLFESDVPTGERALPENEFSRDPSRGRPETPRGASGRRSSAATADLPESGDGSSSPGEVESTTVSVERGPVGELLWGVDSLLADERAFLESHAAEVEGEVGFDLDLEGVFVRGPGNHIGMLEFLDAETGAPTDFAETNEDVAREFAWMVAEEMRRTHDDIAYAADREPIHATREDAARYADQFEELREKRKIFPWKGGYVVVHPKDITNTRKELRKRLREVHSKYGIKTNTAWYSLPEKGDG